MSTIWKTKETRMHGSHTVQTSPNYNRLVALKNKYDPTNFFRMNHNIKPSQTTSTEARA